MNTLLNNRYKVLETIKESKKGSEYKGFDTKENRDVIIKVVNTKNLDSASLEKLNNQISIMNKVDSPYSIKCYETFNSLSEMYIILEYCPENLSDKMKSLKNKARIFYIKKIFNQLFEVYKKLHEINVIIRELRPENILIKYNSLDETDFDIKICDYSYSKELSDEEETQTIIGKSVYVAPEISRGFTYTNKCDLWSIGILGYILYFDALPKFKNKKTYECEIIIEEDFNLEDLIKKLLIAKPEDRISWEDFFSHNFFKQKNFGEIDKKDVDEVLQKYPKICGFEGVEFELYYDKELNFYGEVIKGTKCFCGRGVYINKELGILFKGQFLNSYLNGKGETIFSDGGFYEGEFKNGAKDGKGKEILPNGNEYDGEWQNDVYEGNGVLKFNNGNVYEGGFMCGVRNGVGKFYTKKNETTYEGKWLNNLRHGKGTIYFNDGRKMEGTWKNGIKDGEFRKYKNKNDKEFIVENFYNGVKIQ